MLPNPLLEVFGYPATDMSSAAVNHRAGRLCPFHNSSGLNCTKNSVTDPLGVCSIRHGNDIAIICPIRFRQNLRIVADAAEFFFNDEQYIALTEVRLNDQSGKSAGNIDIVLVTLDEQKRVKDFAALEVQAVYISGNIKDVFKDYMKDPAGNLNASWPRRNYPTPDYLSSSRKRLAPQLIYKGGILRAWNKKLAVAVHRSFFSTLPTLPTVSAEEADIAWFVYDLGDPPPGGQYTLQRTGVVYTKFGDALDTITNPQPGDMSEFTKMLQGRIRKGKIMGTPPQPEVPPTLLPGFDLADALDSPSEVADDDFSET